MSCSSLTITHPMRAALVMVAPPRQRHGAAPALKRPRRHRLRVLPVARPAEAHGVRAVRDAVEELRRVVVLGEVRQARRRVEGREVRPVEGAWEVLRCGSAERRAGLDGEW